MFDIIANPEITVACALIAIVYSQKNLYSPRKKIKRCWKDNITSIIRTDAKTTLQNRYIKSKLDIFDTIDDLIAVIIKIEDKIYHNALNVENYHIIINTIQLQY
jgi:hypothetical protein